MTDDIVTRKQQHIELALDGNLQMSRKPFEKYVLPYQALPEIDLAQVTTEVTLLGKKLSQPLIIASMTGGSQHAKDINSNLAKAAESKRVAMGVGSQRVALEVDDAKDSFKLVRKYAPTTAIFANMGAVQLNYGHSVRSYQEVVDMIQADALYLHLNPLQEALQPEGDTNFESILAKIENLVRIIKVPVFVKEVGHGLSPGCIKQLVEVGVQGIDIAGTGGTSWAGIEAKRAQNDTLFSWFKEIGWPCDLVLKSIQTQAIQTPIVASGGIRSPLDGLKAHLLGATYYSAAQPFLAAGLESSESVETVLETWRRGLAIGLFAIGAINWGAAGTMRLAEIEKT